jgi:hypothetical protein
LNGGAAVSQVVDRQCARGDHIVIDTSQRVPTPPGIFVIGDGPGLVARRIEHELEIRPAQGGHQVDQPRRPDLREFADEVGVASRPASVGSTSANDGPAR